MAPRHVPGRPLVVLAGWLGCRPTSLRRYESLYHKLGFGVVTRIATPRMVVMSSAQAASPVVLPAKWPHKRQRVQTIHDLAWDVLSEIDSSQCSVLLLHVFSNGGCFVWEQVRNILSARGISAKHEEAYAKLCTMRSKLSGVVFDSSPASYSATDSGTLILAMQYCEWKERIVAYAQFALQLAFLSLAEREERAFSYFESMKSDPWDLRQLYLFSKDDPLANHDGIEELARHRQEQFGSDRISIRQWESSPHCCHLLKHPVDYEDALTTFVDQCLHGNVQKSRL